MPIRLSLALTLVLLPACGSSEQDASSLGRAASTQVSAHTEPHSQADVERAFLRAGLELKLNALDEACEDREPPTDVEIVPGSSELIGSGSSECFEFFVKLDPSTPDPQFFGSGGRDSSFWSVSVYASEAEAQKASAHLPPADSLTPPSEGWRTESIGNVAVLYKEPMLPALRSALDDL